MPACTRLMLHSACQIDKIALLCEPAKGLSFPGDVLSLLK